MTNQVDISFNHVTKRFSDVVAVNDLSLDIMNGETFGLLGPNGAGKTTTLNLLAGLLQSDGGTIHIAEYSLPKDITHARSLMGFCPQEISSIAYLTGVENARLFGTLNGLRGDALRARITRIFDDLKLTDKAKKRVSTYSGGMKRRLNLILAILHEPAIIILDEPTAGLDPQTRRVVWDYIRSFKAAGKTIVLTTHYIEEADELCDRVGIIDNGKIIALDTPRKLKEQLVATEEFEFTLPPATSLPQENFSGLDYVVNCTFNASNGVAKVQTKRGIPHLNELLAHLPRGINLEGLHIREFNLEDLFIQLTGREIRVE